LTRRFLIFVVVVVAACNGTHPSAPTGGSPAQNGPYFTRHFKGVVLTEDDHPVPAATVKIGSSLTATTDGNGVYQLDLSEPAQWLGEWGWVTHTLYEDTEKGVRYAPGQTDVTQNFRLYRSMTLAAGDSAHLAITPDNSVCTNDDDVYICRKVHVSVPSGGTLVLDTIADDPSNTFWLLSLDDYFHDATPKDTHLSSYMDTAKTVVVLVLRPENIGVAGGFTLKTAFAP
jgi:hypothetical protein